MFVFEDACEHAGLPTTEIKGIAKELERLAVQAQKLGLQVYGGTYGSGNLRYADKGDAQPLIIVAGIKGDWNGGDSAGVLDEKGLFRGE
jgi:hypothetical protein